MTSFLSSAATGGVLGYLALAIAAPTALAEPAERLAQATGTAADLALISPRVTIDYRSSGGGYDGFGGIEGFVPLVQTPGKNITYVDGRFNLDNDANVGTSLLVGHRLLKHEAVFGGYIGYDLRETDRSTFHQIGLGLEAFWQDWETRLNGYIPVGDTRNRVGTSGSASAGFAFQGNSLVLDGLEERFEAALTGVDFEIGHRLAAFENGGDLKGYGGLYYYDA